MKIRCIFCGKSLMCKEHKLDKKPSVKIIVAAANRRGHLFLSSSQGSSKTRMDIALPDGRIPHFYCPHCKKEFKDRRRCERCSAPLIPLEREAGGLLLFCARKGCENFQIETESLDARVKALYDAYYAFHDNVSECFPTPTYKENLK